MLPKRERLTTHTISLPREGLRIYHTDRLTLAVSNQHTRKPSKFAVIVLKKGITAVERNRIRRRIYEAIGALRKNLKSEGYFCVFSLKKGVSKDIPYSVFLEDVGVLFKKADIINV